MAKKISASVGKGGKNKPADTSGQATLTDSTDINGGNPPPSAVLTIDAPASSAQEHVVAAFPIGGEFFYDPAEFGPATSLDFALDVLAEPVTGASHVDITLAVLQRDDYFIAEPNPSTPSFDGSEAGWTRLSADGFEAHDFLAVDGGDATPDFSEPFQFAYAFHADYTSTLGVEMRLDNMEATVNTIPEPTSVGLVMALGAAVLWSRWWNDEDR